MTAVDSASQARREGGAESVQPKDAPPRTTVPPRLARRRQRQPRPLTMIRLADVLAVVGALLAAVATTALLWQQISPFSGILGYVVVSWVLFVIYYAVLVSFTEDGPAVRDRVSAVVVQSLAALVIVALGFIIIYTLFRGWAAFRHLNFFIKDGKQGGPQNPLTQGGALHAIVGTLIEIGIAMAIAVPLGLLAAVFMNEVPGPYSRFIRTIVDAMTAMPDVLAGLFIYAVLVLTTGQSGLAAGVALAITALPIICRAADVVLRLMPGGLKEASFALGSGQWRTVRHVTLPTVRSGLATAVILGAARAIGETAPVLLTAGATDYLQYHPTGGPMMSLPLMAYTEVLFSPTDLSIARGFGAASVLLALVVVLFVTARIIGGRGPGQLSASQRRRRAAASRRDLARYARRARAAQAGLVVQPGAAAVGDAGAVGEWQ
jgi:phosphate transport system permease protein